MQDSIQLWETAAPGCPHHVPQGSPTVLPCPERCLRHKSREKNHFSSIGKAQGIFCGPGPSLQLAVFVSAAPARGWFENISEQLQETQRESLAGSCWEGAEGGKKGAERSRRGQKRAEGDKEGQKGAERERGAERDRKGQKGGREGKRGTEREERGREEKRGAEKGREGQEKFISILVGRALSCAAPPANMEKGITEGGGSRTRKPSQNSQGRSALRVTCSRWGGQQVPALPKFN